MFNSNDIQQLYNALQSQSGNLSILDTDLQQIYNKLNTTLYQKDIKSISIPTNTSPTTININEPTAKFIRIIEFKIISFKLNTGVTNSSIDFVCDDFVQSIFFYYYNSNASNVFNLIISANNAMVIGALPNTFVASNNRELILKNTNPKIKINFNLIPYTANSKISVIYEILY